ncbi:MAG: acyltransferase [Frankiales bacterium]|nr:acyltransferase [Frankiales bacterium]
MRATPVATPVRATPSPNLRFPELQGQRGLAALAVVIFHSYQYDRSGPTARYPLQDSWVHPYLVGLDGMVDWFFVLSAFLLTLPYARALLEGRPLATATEFLGRRAVRIVPLYFIAVLVVWVSRNPTLPGEWRDLVEHLTFTQVYDDQRIFYTIGPAWSLAVEVQFYVVLAVLGGVLARTASRRATPRARLAPLIGAIMLLACLSVAWWVVAGLVQERPATDYSIWLGLPAKLAVFAVGMATAVVVAARPRSLSRRGAWALRAGGIGLALAVMTILDRRDSGASDWVFHTTCAVAFAAVVLAGALGPQSGPWHRASARGFLPWLGLVSYSLYLWHEPLLLHLAGNGLLPAPSASAFWQTVAILLPLSLVAAWVSYWVVEYPFSHLRFFLGEVPDRDLQLERRTAP